MKKFSKIVESNEYDQTSFKRSPLVNKEFWDIRIQPLIDSVLAAHPSLFSRDTIQHLIEFVRNVNKDYIKKATSTIQDANDFFKAFEIEATKDEVMDYIQEFIDNSYDLYENFMLASGEYKIGLSDFNYKDFKDFVMDLKGAYSKLFMLIDCGFDIQITYKYKNNDNITRRKISSDVSLPGQSPKKANIDEWLSLNSLDELSQLANLVVEIYIFNPIYRLKA
jgi:hypothetical protein